MTGATTWHGRRGPVLLGPTEHRVARWLADMTRHGLITIRTLDLAAATHVERSEAYRITARLRVLGLFGIENDRGGNHNGRRIWRTSIETDPSGLDAVKHREAWARLVAWARARQARVRTRLAELAPNHTRSAVRSSARTSAADPTPAEALTPSAGVNHGLPALGQNGAGRTFLERLVAGGLGGRLASEFGASRGRR